MFFTYSRTRSDTTCRSCGCIRRSSQWALRSRPDPLDTALCSSAPTAHILGHTIRIAPSTGAVITGRDQRTSTERSSQHVKRHAHIQPVPQRRRRRRWRFLVSISSTPTTEDKRHVNARAGRPPSAHTTLRDLLGTARTWNRSATPPDNERSTWRAHTARHAHQKWASHHASPPPRQPMEYPRHHSRELALGVLTDDHGGRRVLQHRELTRRLGTPHQVRIAREVVLQHQLRVPRELVGKFTVHTGARTHSGGRRRSRRKAVR